MIDFHLTLLQFLTGDSAFGHPLGATGARQVVTALAELRRQDKRVAVTSMCVGTVSPLCSSVIVGFADEMTGHGYGRYFCVRALSSGDCFRTLSCI